MKIFFLFVSVFVSIFSFAQTEADIRKHYQEVNKQIAESIENGFEGPLYQNQWVTNKNSRSWPAVGLYQDTANFWYDDPPDHLSASDRNPKVVLLKVMVGRRASHYQVQEEYLYKDGKLLFFYSHEGEEGKEWETRAWFNAKGLLIKSSVKIDGKELKSTDFTKEEYKDLKPNPLNIQKEGKNYQDLFVKSMM